MKQIEQIVFRRLTDADFFNIYKPRGSEARGGGQSYIDFPTTTISASAWEKFFKDQKRIETESGPKWRFPVRSVGLKKQQLAEIGQRRPASFSIRSQKLGTRESNRIFAWHPDNGFPKPKDPSSRKGPKNLVIYIARTVEGEYWAGWFMRSDPDPTWGVTEVLLPIFKNSNGVIDLSPPADFDETNSVWPFGPYEKGSPAPTPQIGLPHLAGAKPKEEKATTKKASPARKERSEEELIEDLFSQDEAADTEPATKEVVQKLIKRNAKAVKTLKDLYKGRCQISGDALTFLKINGELYSEAHHLVPLGKGGADSPFNLIVVSPLIHRMLHYARVGGIDLKAIKNNKLEITINDQPFTISWHPKHAQLVNDAALTSDL